MTPGGGKHDDCFYSEIRCASYGKITPATIVDHIVPHRGDMLLFWDQENWQALCKECHDQKTGHGL